MVLYRRIEKVFDFFFIKKSKKKINQIKLFKEFTLNVGCRLNLPYAMVPILYRTHTHELGTAVSGYVVRDNKWIELGRKSPQDPQAFYPVSTPNLILTNRDIIATRCTFNSKLKNSTTPMGFRLKKI